MVNFKIILAVGIIIAFFALGGVGITKNAISQAKEIGSEVKGILPKKTEERAGAMS